MYVITLDGKPYQNDKGGIRTYKTIGTANAEVTRLIKRYSRYWLKAGTVITVAEFAFKNVVNETVVPKPEEMSVPHA